MQVDSWRQLEEQPKITDNHTDTEEETWQSWPNRYGWCTGPCTLIYKSTYKNKYVQDKVVVGSGEDVAPGEDVALGFQKNKLFCFLSRSS